MLFFHPMLEIRSVGFGWNKMIPKRFLLTRSFITIYFIDDGEFRVFQVSFFAKFGIFGIGPSFNGSVLANWWDGHDSSLIIFIWILFSDELYWCSNRQKDTGKQACWTNGILVQLAERNAYWDRWIFHEDLGSGINQINYLVSDSGKASQM